MKNVYVNIDGKYEQLFYDIQKNVGLSQKFCVLEALIAYGMRLGIIKNREDFIMNGIK